MLPLGNRHAFVMHVLLFEFVGVDEPELGGLDEVPVLVLVFELEADLSGLLRLNLALVSSCSRISIAVASSAGFRMCKEWVKR